MKLLAYIVKPLIRLEIPGWGPLYDRCIGGYEYNGDWAGALPRVIRDKRYGLIRVLNITEWADRVFFFLGRWYDLKTQLIMEKVLSDGNVVVDAGANYGHFTLAAASLVGKTGSVIAFEPNPNTYARLTLHIQLNQLSNVNIQNAGLADKPGTLTLNVPRINSGEASFTASDYTDTYSVECPVRVGDKEIGDQQINFIKIDVEGFEVRVLLGFIETIKRDQPWILTEVFSRHLMRDNRTPTDLETLLCDLGYTPMLVGLAGPPGRFKHVALFEFDSQSDEGDVLWVPQHKRSLISDFKA